VLWYTTTKQLVEQDVVINEIECFLKVDIKILIIFSEQSDATNILCITFYKACVL